MDNEPSVFVPEDLTIVTREFWEADPPSRTHFDHFHPVRHIWYIYNIGTPFCKTKTDCRRFVKLLQKRCMDAMEMSDIPFNFLIGGDGRVYEGRGWFYQPPAFRAFPDEGCDRIDIGYINNGSKDDVTYQMVRSTMNLINLGLRHGYINHNYKNKEWHAVGEPMEDDPNKPFG